MIEVRRSPEPAILKKNAVKWLRGLKSAKTEAERSRARARYRNTQVKKALVELFHGKCAYCESRITHVDYGHIEHYHPKSGDKGRQDLTFEWSNLLLACGVCNGGEHKSDHFPDEDEDGPIINPCEDEPSNHLEFRWDEVARIASVYGSSNRGRTTERLLGLNRPELRSHRSTYVKKLHVLARYADIDPDAADLLRQAIEPTEEYSAFARSFVRG